MAEIAGAEFQAALFVGETPATGVVGAIAGDGTVKVLEAWDPVQGDVTHTAPAGSAGGGGTRRHLFDREVYVDSTGLGAYVNVRAWASITGKPTTVGGYGITDAITTAGGQTIAGTLNTSGAVTINTNATYFTGKTAGAVAKRLIGVNAGGLVSIDTDAAGATFGAGVVVAGAITTGTDAANDLGAGSFRFRAGFFSGAVTAGSLALSGAISGVTTLAGTGAVSGFTTANFSGTVVGLSFNTTLSDTSNMLMRNAAAKNILYVTNLFNFLGSGSVDNSAVGVFGSLSFFPGNGGTLAFRINADASVTFGNGLTVSAGTTAVQAVTATAFLSKSDLATYSEPSAQVRAVGSTDPNKQVVMGINTTANVGFIQAVQFGTGNFQLSLNPNGGTVVAGGVFRNDGVSGGFAMGVVSSVPRITYTDDGGGAGHFAFLSTGNGDATLLTGALKAETDNAFDIGTGSNRFRNMTLSGTATVASVAVTSSTTAIVTLDTTTGATSDNNAVHFKRGGTIKWRIGNNVTGTNIDAFNIYNDALGNQVLAFANTTGVASFTANVAMPSATVSSGGYDTNITHDGVGLKIQHNSSVRDIRIGVNSGNGVVITTSNGIQFPNVGTTASAANAFLDNANSNNVLRSTSSLQYKEVADHLALSDALEIMRGLEPFWYHSKASADLVDGQVDRSRWFLGFAAEHAEQIEATRGGLHTVDEHGAASWLQYERLTAVHNVVLNEHDRAILELQAFRDRAVAKYPDLAAA